MKDVSRDYLNAVTDYGREWQNTVIIKQGNVTETYTSCDITIEEVFSESDNLSMGKSFSSKCSIKLYEPQRTILYNNATIYVVSKLKVGNEFVSIPMGTYFPSEVITNDDYETLEITAYDYMSKLNGDYAPSINLPATPQALVEDIATHYGFSIKSDVTYDTDKIKTIPECTVAEMLGYIAGIQGKNAIFDGNGELDFRWYRKNTVWETKEGDTWVETQGTWIDLNSGDEKTWGDLTNITWSELLQSWGSLSSSPKEITRSKQKQDGLSFNEGTFTIQSITSGIEGNVIVEGTGKGISYENPFVKQKHLHGIGLNVLGKTYYVGEVDTFGNPMIEVGDVIFVEDKQGNRNTFFVSNITWDLSGGCSSIITSVGQADAEIEFSTQSPTEKKLSGVKTSLQEARSQLSQIINTEEGIYSITTRDGVSTGWTIVDNAETPRNVVVATNGGIAIGTHGLDDTQYQTAITGQGIVADAITTGSLNADLITTGTLNADLITTGEMSANRISGGTLTLGGNNDVNGKLVVKNSSGTTIGTWNSNGVSIKNGDVNLKADDSDYSKFSVSSILTNSKVSISPLDVKVYVSNNSYNDLTASGMNVYSNTAGTDVYAGGIYLSASNGKYISLDMKGTTLSGYQIEGNTKAKANAWDTYSLEELKTNITPCENVLEKVKDSDIYSYSLKDDLKDGIEKPRYGFVIGENRNTPNEVISFDGTCIDTYSMTSILWKAVQELSAKVDELETKLNGLEKGEKEDG